MRRPASSDLHLQNTDRTVATKEIAEDTIMKNHIQSSFWALSLFTLLFALALLSILNLGQNDR